MDNDDYVAELAIEGRLFKLDPSALRTLATSEDSSLSYVLRQVMGPGMRHSDNVVRAFTNYI